MSIANPELIGKFRMPKATAGPEPVVYQPGFRDDAEPLKNEFIQHRLPPDFIESLHAAV